MKRTTLRLRPIAALVSATVALAGCDVGSGAGAGRQVVVQLGQGGDIEAVRQAVDGKLLEQLDGLPYYLLAVPRLDETTIAAIENVPGVVFAEQNFAVSTPRSSSGIKNSVTAIGKVQTQVEPPWAELALHLAQAHRTSRGAGVVVAVLDTGVDHTHPDLRDHMARRPDGKVLGIDFIDGDGDPMEEGIPVTTPEAARDSAAGHGTHVAGIVARAAPDARIMAVRTLGVPGEGTVWQVAQGLHWAVDPDRQPATADGAQVISISQGTPQPSQLVQHLVEVATCMAFRADNPLYRDPGFDSHRRRCADGAEAVVIAAAGNSGNGEPLYPSAFPIEGLLSVTASTAGRELAEFASTHASVAGAMPGDRITSTFYRDSYATMSGTSMAAPWAAGTAALVLATMPGPAPGVPRAGPVTQRLLTGATPLAGTSIRQIDPVAALQGSR